MDDSSTSKTDFDRNQMYNLDQHFIQSMFKLSKSMHRKAHKKCNDIRGLQFSFDFLKSIYNFFQSRYFHVLHLK